MDIKSIEWGIIENREKVWIGPSFISAAKDVAGGTNGYSGTFGDDKSSMLMVDGKGIAHCKKRGTGVAEDTESANGDSNEVNRQK